MCSKVVRVDDSTANACGIKAETCDLLLCTNDDALVMAGYIDLTDSMAYTTSLPAQLIANLMRARMASVALFVPSSSSFALSCNNVSPTVSSSSACWSTLVHSWSV